MEGTTETKNYWKALQWFTKSAAQGDSVSQNAIGLLYYHGGPGLDQDYEKAAYWLEKSAKSGYKQAIENLALFYSTGEGVERDEEKAVYWFELWASQGNETDQHALAKLFTSGELQQKIFYNKINGLLFSK